MALVVVAYDIAHDRRWAKMHTLLLGFGQPVQESVFECELDEATLARMRRQIKALVRRGDLVRLYPLCVDCAAAVVDGDAAARQPAPAAYLT